MSLERWMLPLTYMTDLSFFHCLVFLQGARGLDGEPGPQGLPGAPVSDFPSTKPNDSFFFFFFCYVCICVQYSLHVNN